MDEILNAEQLAAVQSTEGFVRVIAGAGSGKTRALTNRFAFLVNMLGTPPENILCVTFTNKAANEMRQRIHNLIGDSDTGYINTFHGFCVTVLQEDSHAISYPKSFLVLDNSDIDAMLNLIYEERGLTLRDMTFSDARNMIEIQKLFKKPEYYLDMMEMSVEVLHEKYLQASNTDDIVFYGYLYQEKKCFALDYNDLIKFTLYIFAHNEEIKLKWQKRLEYIMIDEFQDIDALQYELMEALSGYHKNLFIVGDPDQTIYTWRGANVRYLLEFDEKHPDTKTVMMVKNYRSSPEILACANSLISRNTKRIKKDLESVLDNGENVTFTFDGSGEDEAKNIVERINRMHEEGIEYRKMTVLYRAHYVTRNIEEAFLKEKLPYHIYSGVPFFGRKEIKDALCYLRMIYAQDDLSFRRIANTPKRNLGTRRMSFLEEYSIENGCSLYTALKRTFDNDLFKGTKAVAFIKLIDEFSEISEEMPVSELLTKILDKSGYQTMLRTEGSQERLDNLAELLQSVHNFETTCGEEATLAGYISHVALFTDADAELDADKIKLMTVHAAKGLEFPYVFLCGMNEGVFPSRKVKDLNGMEEERRLAFVAMTRAQKGLFISAAEGRNFDGSPRYPSRFVMDIDEGLIEYTKKPNEGLIEAARTYVKSNESHMPENLISTLFPPGTRVKHDYLGEGTVIEANLDKNTYLIKFDSIPTARSISAKVIKKAGE